MPHTWEHTVNRNGFVCVCVNISLSMGVLVAQGTKTWAVLLSTMVKRKINQLFLVFFLLEVYTDGIAHAVKNTAPPQHELPQNSSRSGGHDKQLWPKICQTSLKSCKKKKKNHRSKGVNSDEAHCSCSVFCKELTLLWTTEHTWCMHKMI